MKMTTAGGSDYRSWTWAVDATLPAPDQSIVLSPQLHMDHRLNQRFNCYGAFRDSVLIPTRAGRGFFDLFYSKYYSISPGVAHAMMADETLRHVLGWALVRPWVTYYRWFLEFPEKSLDGVQEPWATFLRQVRDDFEHWASVLSAPTDLNTLSAEAAAEELALLLRYALRTPSSILQGLIPVVDLPPLRAREGDRQRKTLRRVLVDRADLDAFIESRKRHDGRSVS